MQPESTVDSATRSGALPPTIEEREARDRQQAHPGRWRAPRAPLDVARYRLIVDLDAAQAEALRKATGDFKLYSGTRVTLSVVHGAGWSRIELGEGLLGARSTIVRGPRDATLFLDQGLRVFLHLAPEQLPGWRDRPISRVSFGDARSDDPGRAPRIDIDVDGVRARIEFDPAPALRAFAAQALALVLGVRAQDRAEFARLGTHGFPVAGITWLEGAREDTPTLRWSVHDLELVTAEPSVFDVPDGWTDLRDTDGVGMIAPRGGYATELITETHSNYAEPLDKSWVVIGGMLTPVPVGTDDGGNQDVIGTCIESRYGVGAGLHVAQRAFDDVRTLVNVALKRVQWFRGENGIINIDWLKQLRDYSDQLPDAKGDGVYGLLRFPPNPENPWLPPNPESPWPPLPTDSPEAQETKRVERFGGIGLVDRAADRGARLLLAAGQHAQLPLPQALLDACNGLVANLAVAPPDRYDILTIEDRTLLREIYAEERIGRVPLKYKTEGKIQELPKTESFPKDLVRYKFYNLSLQLELHEPVEDITARGDILRHLFVSGPNSISGDLQLFRINGTAVVLRWPGLAFGAFGAGVWLACLFVPVACAALAPLAAVVAWLVLDAASVAITLRSPRIDFVISWILDAKKNDQCLYPTVQTKLVTTSRSVVYVSAVPDGLHEIIMAVISLGLSFSTEVEDALADELRDVIEETLRDDAKLVYPPGQGGLGQQIDSAGAFAATPERLGFGAHYRRPEHPILPLPWATLVDPLNVVLARATTLDALYTPAFPAPSDQEARKARPYAVFAWSVNLLNAYLWTRWAERRFEMPILPDPLGATLAAAIESVYPTWRPHHHQMRLLCATPPRVELTPWTFEGGARTELPLPAAPFGDAYARVTFDDLRVCAPLRGSEMVLELSFPATVAVDVVLGSVRANGELDVFTSPEISFDILFDRPSVVAGPWATAATRVQDGPPATPLAVDNLHVALTGALSEMLASRPATAVRRAVSDARNVQRYAFGPLMLTAIMVPAGGYLYAYVGLPRLPRAGVPIGYDPVVWFADVGMMPKIRETARTALRYVNEVG
jgi:hypothetical protein